MNASRAAYAVLDAARRLYPGATTVDVYNYGGTTRLDVFKADTEHDRTLPGFTVRSVRTALDGAAEAYAALAFGPRSAWPKHFTITHTGPLDVTDADRTAGDHVFNGRVWTGIGEQAIQAAHDMLDYRREMGCSELMRVVFGFQYDVAVRNLELAAGAPKGYRLFALARSIVKHNPVSPRSAWVAAGAVTR
ncbi:hypothetical protein [Streptomyces sp. SPB4]|uniref:hypothetical protein n=1 Tax=Streptomyces sp. SPB4 TaxID=2940553 RepID=UPI0024769283|nr:hypothetical protein [Streptomyces sp. SPB4]MDH6544141.1 hypothetical protein [Streptomyces sp. SPB4]